MSKFSSFLTLAMLSIGQFAAYGQVVQLVGIGDGGVALGDYDSDGDLDVLIAGATQTTCCVGPAIAKIYRNDGNGVFTDIGAPLLGLSRAAVAWVDYDNDGDLDCFITGMTDNFYFAARLYRNEGNDRFTEIPVDLAGGEYGRIEWGDYDNDGDLDLLYCGGGATRLFRSDGNDVIIPISIGLLSVSYNDM